MTAAEERDRAGEALFAIDASCDRDTWVRIGMAAKAAGLDFEDFDRWSAGGANYGGERDTRSVWRSFKPGGGINAATLFASARAAGWREQTNGRQHEARQRPQGPRSAEGRAEGPPFDWRAVWEAAEPATAGHPYIESKLGLSDGLRVRKTDGALLVPVYDADGSLQSWQAIPADGGKKLNARGARVSGGSFTVGGEPRDGEPVYIVEGVGAAWAAHQASQRPAVVTFGAGNTKRIAEQVRERYPGARIVVVADRGKESEAGRIAAAVGGSCVELPEQWRENSDIGDLFVRDGMAAVAELLANEKNPETEGLPPLKKAADLLRQDFAPIRWLIPGLLPEGLMMLAARPKVGKSWLALDVAIATATGGQVLGRKVARGDVLYLALEDSDRRMHSRLTKLQAAGEELGDFEYATEWPRGAEGAAAIHKWIGAHPNARLVVVDVFTKLRAAVEGRETAYSTDYTDVSMLKPPGDRAVSVLLVHHTRKAEGEDPIDSISGTLGIGGAADGAWIIKRARGADEAELHLIGRDLEEEGAFGVRFDRASCRWQWVGEAWKVRMSSERRQALDAMAEEPMKPAELAKALGKTQGWARKMVYDMAQDGQIERGHDGRYRPVAPEGTF